MPRCEHHSKTGQAAVLFLKSLIYDFPKFIFDLPNAEHCFYAPVDVASPLDKIDEHLTVIKSQRLLSQAKRICEWHPH